MARSPEQVLKEIVSDQIFQIAQLVSINEKLADELKQLKDNSKPGKEPHGTE